MSSFTRWINKEYICFQQLNNGNYTKSQEALVLIPLLPETFCLVWSLQASVSSPLTSGVCINHPAILRFHDSMHSKRQRSSSFLCMLPTTHFKVLLHYWLWPKSNSTIENKIVKYIVQYIKAAIVLIVLNFWEGVSHVGCTLTFILHVNKLLL